MKYTLFFSFLFYCPTYPRATGSLLNPLCLSRLLAFLNPARRTVCCRPVSLQQLPAHPSIRVSSMRRRTRPRQCVPPPEPVLAELVLPCPTPPPRNLGCWASSRSRLRSVRPRRAILGWLACPVCVSGSLLPASTGLPPPVLRNPGARRGYGSSATSMGLILCSELDSLHTSPRIGNDL